MSKLRDDAGLYAEVYGLSAEHDRSAWERLTFTGRMDGRKELVTRILDAVDRQLAARASTPGAPAPRPGRYPCKPWCGMKEAPASEGVYTRKGLCYCRDRCVREASRFERLGPDSAAPGAPAEPAKPNQSCCAWHFTGGSGNQCLDEMYDSPAKRIADDLRAGTFVGVKPEEK
jgi:hypothetical protein